MFNRFLRAAKAIDDHWVGDLLGAACLFVGAYGGFMIGYGVGL